MSDDSTSKKILDSALNALLKGLQLSPWVKVPTTFVAELSKRFKSLPDEEKRELATAKQEPIEEFLADNTASDRTPSRDEFASAIRWATIRDGVLDSWYGLNSAALNELISRVDGARENVSETAPRRTQVGQLVDWLESTEGPQFSELVRLASDLLTSRAADSPSRLGADTANPDSGGPTPPTASGVVPLTQVRLNGEASSPDLSVISLFIASSFDNADKIERLREVLTGSQVDYRGQVFSLRASTSNLAELEKRIGSSDIFIAAGNYFDVSVQLGIAISNGVPIIKLGRSHRSWPRSSIVIRQTPTTADQAETATAEILKGILSYLDDSAQAARFYLRRLWSLDTTKTTAIVPSRHPEGTRSTNPLMEYGRMKDYGDPDALVVAKETVERLYPYMQSEIVEVSRESPNFFDWVAKRNVVVVGGADTNRAACNLRDCCPIGYIYDPDDDSKPWLFDKESQDQIWPAELADTQVTDHGFFFRTRYNTSSNGALVFLGGGHSWGVRCAAELAEYPRAPRPVEEIETLKELVTGHATQSILAVLKTQGTRDHWSPPDLVTSRWEDLNPGQRWTAESVPNQDGAA